MTKPELCHAIVKRGGVHVIRDGKDHRDKANRCLVTGGKCVGYYEVLTRYDETTDTFQSGITDIPSDQVDLVCAWNIARDLTNAIEQSLI